MKYNNRGIGSRRLVVNRNALKSQIKFAIRRTIMVFRLTDAHLWPLMSTNTAPIIQEDILAS